MTTERSSFEDPGTDPTAMGDDALGNVDAIVGTREDEMTSAGLSDAPFPTGSSTSTSMGSGSMGSSYGSSGSGDRLQSAAGGVVDRVAGTAQQQVGTQVNSQLSRAADMVGQVSQAIRQSGEQMRDQQPQIASFADTAAQQVDKASQFLRQNDFQGLVREAENLARRQPALFLGGALALGVIASRFLKASPQGGGSMGSGQYGRGFSGYGGSYGSAGYGGSYGGAGYGSTGYGAGYGSSGYGGDSYGSQQANYGTSNTGPYGGSTTSTTYAEPGSGATSDQGAEHGGV